MTSRLYHLIIGSNLGDRTAQIDLAKRLITESFAQIQKESSVYETQPWGYDDQPWFLNQVMAVVSELHPAEVLCQIKNIEVACGRRPGEKWHARHLDIDILLCGDLIWNKEGLEIPHPLMHTRNFVLIPLLEIGSDFIHPVLGKTIEEIYEECRDTGEVYIFNPDEQDNPL